MPSVLPLNVAPRLRLLEPLRSLLLLPRPRPLPLLLPRPLPPRPPDDVDAVPDAAVPLSVATGVLGTLLVAAASLIIQK